MVGKLLKNKLENIMIVIDSSYIQKKLIHTKDLAEQIKTDPEIFVYAFLNSILKIKRQFGGSKDNRFVLAIDRKGFFTNRKGDKTRGYWRHVYYDKNIETMANPKEHYKDGRKYDQNEIDWKTLNSECKGVEADDIIAILAQKSKQKTIIVANDKDLKQLVGDNVYYYNYMKNEYENNVLDEVENNLFFLKGDAGDAICGVLPRYQWKKLLIDKNMNLDEALQIASDKKNVDVDLLKKRFEINKKLMDLSLDNIPNSIINKVMNAIKQPHYNFKQRKLMSAINTYKLDRFTEGNIRSIDDRVQEFKLQETTKTTKTVTDTNKFAKINNALSELL